MLQKIRRLIYHCISVLRKYVRIRTLVLLLLGLVLVKKLVLERVRSLSEIEALIKSGQLRKVLLGNVLIFVFTKGVPWYRGGMTFGTISPKNPIELYNLASKNNVKRIAGLFPNEGHIVQAAVISLSFWISFLMIKTISDQSSYQAKKKD